MAGIVLGNLWMGVRLNGFSQKKNWHLFINVGSKKNWYLFITVSSQIFLKSRRTCQTTASSLRVLWWKLEETDNFLSFQKTETGKFIDFNFFKEPEPASSLILICF